MTTNNTIAQKAARRKLNLLQLANDLGNVSEACKRIGSIQENSSMRYVKIIKPSACTNIVIT